MPRKPTARVKGRRTARRPAIRPATPELTSKLRKYIDVILDVGINLQPGQRLLIVNSLIQGVDVSLAPFVRMVAEAAYRRGSSYVDVIWGDPLLERTRLRHAPRESMAYYPKWPSDARWEHVEGADAYLALRADDPDLMARIDSKLVGQYLAAIREKNEKLMSYMTRNSANWCVATVSAPAWAAKVLPKVPASRREARLWELIFETCRLDRGDVVGSWRKHIAELGRRKAYLNARQYRALTYAGPGTRLRVGLPPDHVWFGGEMKAENGVTFVPNLPTEEVFTLPDRLDVEGEVAATKPLGYSGNTIEGMHLTFSAGRVVKFSARKGQGILEELLDSDEGSRRLGEVALVPHSSPVSQMGVTFHSTLFDENAACHLALGMAYRFTLKDAESSSDDEFNRRGGNTSKVHSDFMIGSGKLDIDGIRQDGSSEPVMRSGEWAFRI